MDMNPRTRENDMSPSQRSLTLAALLVSGLLALVFAAKADPCRLELGGLDIAPAEQANTVKSETDENRIDPKAAETPDGSDQRPDADAD